MINFAQYGLIIVLSIFLILHICVLLKIVPYSIVWGGRLKTDEEMYRFETVSIIINIFFLFVILIHTHFLTIDFPKKTMTIILWVMTALFLVNTFGNAISKNKIEKKLFTPITIILTIFSLILALTN